MTHKLYYDDPMKREFDAVVVQTEQAPEHADVVLDRTCFYPEGGGQPADRGAVDGIRVLDVRKRGESIIHRLQRAPDSTTVHGAIDWNHRFDFMQQHTGQHIISASMVHIGGYNTVAVHQGERYTTIECDVAEIPDDRLAAIEDLANETVGRNLDIRAFSASQSQISVLQLRREPKVSGTVRIVEIDGFDRVACGGVHTLTSGQVGIIKLVGSERIRGNLRTLWKIGRRALDDYREKTEIVNALVDRLSARQHELIERADRLDQALKQAQYNERSIAARLCSVLAGQLHNAAVQHGALRIVTHRFEGQTPDLFRGVLEAVIVEPGTCACLVNVEPQRVYWIIGCSADLSLDFDAARDRLLPIISARGGGRASIWQGIGTEPLQATRFLHAFEENAHYLTR
ncbi:MAG: alanyl-tRNA editing protein [Spirochaetaceae bacterium]|nr:MAG: alanyl-tRNA editing protein [Spirochaetaceae bacterium]